MVHRLHGLSKWARLNAGDLLALAPGSHKVRVQFNCEDWTRVDVLIGDQPVFIAAFQGMETLEFTVPDGADHLICTSDGEVWYFTDESLTGDPAVLEAVSMTKIMQRRARNPQLEMMMFKMQQNIDRRLSAQAAELEAWKATHGVDAETGEVDAAVGDGAADAGAAGAGAAAGGDPEVEAAGAPGGDAA